MHLSTRLYKDKSISSLTSGRTKPSKGGRGQENPLCWEIEGGFTLGVILVFQLKAKRDVCLIYKEPNISGEMRSSVWLECRVLGVRMEARGNARNKEVG